jgi:hypothetical protein
LFVLDSTITQREHLFNLRSAIFPCRARDSGNTTSSYSNDPIQLLEVITRDIPWRDIGGEIDVEKYP